VRALVDEQADDLERLVLVDVLLVVAEAQMQLAAVPELEDVALAVVLAEQLPVRAPEVLVVRPGEQDDAALELLFELRQGAAEDGDLLSPAYCRQSVIASTIANSDLPPPTAPP
jgi:hypothetical protein